MSGRIWQLSAYRLPNLISRHIVRVPPFRLPSTLSCIIHALLFLCSPSPLPHLLPFFSSSLSRQNEWTSERRLSRRMAEPPLRQQYCHCRLYNPPPTPCRPCRSTLANKMAPCARISALVYADWCGPCKMIAPHYERLAKEHSRPKKVAFAKVNVDSQSSVARSNNVAAMPTFKIFHGGNCVETIKGANPSALTEAITKAVRLADAAPGGKSGDAFKSPGRTLGNEQPVAGGRAFDFGNMFNMIIIFVGLYLVSLFSARNNPKEE